MSFTELTPHLNRLFAYLEVAQKKGAFTFKQSSDIYQHLSAIQTIFNRATDQTDDARQQQNQRSRAQQATLPSKSVKFADEQPNANK